MRRIGLVLVAFLMAGCRGEASGEQFPTPAASVPAEPVAAASRAERLPLACPAGRWPVGGRCVAVEDAFAVPGGQTYWVAQQHPQADDANPGTRTRPWRTISRATTVLQPGDAVVVRAGIYRETVAPRAGGRGPQERITYAAYPGEEVVVTGADVVEGGWVRAGTGWRRAWTGPPLPSYAGEGDRRFRREMVVADGRVLRPVYARSEVQPGTFLAEGPDAAPTSVLLRLPGDGVPAEGHVLEVAHRTYLFRPLGADPDPECGDPATPGWLRLVGFTFRHAANRAQWGAVCAGSVGALVEHVTVEWTNGAGLDASGRDHRFLRVASNHHGQIGWVGSCDGCLFEDTEAVGNNGKGHDPAWEAGGGKWTDTRGSVWRRHRALGNDGPGLWLDGDNASNTIEGCLVRGNALAGIMLELATTRTLVQHNRVEGTRWSVYSGAGILSQAASDNALVHNTVVANEGTGVWLRLDPERRAPDGHTRLYNNLVLGNATTATEEAREIAVEGRDAEHARTHRLDGNTYGSHARNDSRTSTFFFHPDGPAGFRSGDLRGWQRRTGGDAHARVIALPPGGWAEASDVGDAVLLPPALSGYGAPTAGPRPFAGRGADPAFVFPETAGAPR